jgi:hypothetical protein
MCPPIRDKSPVAGSRHTNLALGEPLFDWCSEPFDYTFPTTMTAILMWRDGEEAFIAADGLARMEKQHTRRN